MYPQELHKLSRCKIRVSILWKSAPPMTCGALVLMRITLPGAPSVKFVLGPRIMVSDVAGLGRSYQKKGEVYVVDAYKASFAKERLLLLLLRLLHQSYDATNSAMPRASRLILRSHLKVSA